MGYTHLDPGDEVEVSENVYFSYSENKEMAELVMLSPEELKKREGESIEQEKAVFSQLKEIAKTWRQQAEHTLNLKKAQDYLRAVPASHTSNKWEEDKYGLHELSNMVYKMTYRIYENEIWRSHQRPQPIVWELSWSVYYNTPLKPDLDSKNHIAGQDRKRFDSKADMEKYLQGRIKAYSHLFTAISPPIPKEDAKRFYVNGILLPGYTIESPELVEPDKTQVDDLLSLLSDEDIGSKAPEPAPELQPEVKTPEAIWSKNRQLRQKSGKTKQAPAR